VNEFVEQCRSEWKRIGVPDRVADEMAADLQADLAEAEAEGASAEEVLGTGAFDPRSFAAAWAAERGVVERPPRSGPATPRSPRILAAIGVFVLVAILGAVLLLRDSSSGETKTAVGPPPGVWVTALPRAARVTVLPSRVAPPVELRFAPVKSDDSGLDAGAVGTVVLTAGVAGIVFLSAFWLWLGRPPRRALVDA
jgi:hypothetical protein